MDQHLNPILSPYVIFSDASFDPRTKTGLAGVTGFVHRPNTLLPESPTILTKAYHRTNCSRLELQSILWALAEIAPMDRKRAISIYTDSKTVCDLPSRRSRLEAVGYRSVSSGKPLRNGDLYKELFLLYDDLDLTFNWIKGHKPKSQYDDFDRIFSMVDRLTRKQLRDFLGH